MKTSIFALLLFISASLQIFAQQDPEGQPGQISRFAWSGFPSSSPIELLRAEQGALRAPSRADIIPFPDIPSNWGDVYGQVFRGYLRAPVTGSYCFWVSADEEVRLFLGKTSDKFSAIQRIEFSNVGEFPATEFGGLREQTSIPINLEAGERYYFELHHKERSGADFVKLAWSYCGGGQFINWATDDSAVASQTSTGFGGTPERAIDGNTIGRFNQGSTSHTRYQANPSWQVDLGATRMIDRVELFNRYLDGPLVASRLRNYRISVLDEAGGVVVSTIRHAAEGSYTEAAELWEIPGIMGRIVKVELLEPGFLALSEVKVFGRPDEAEDCPHLDDVPYGALQNWTWDPAAEATQSSTSFEGEASHAIDGNESGYYASGSITHTTARVGSFWQVDLGVLRQIDRVEIFNRDLDQPQPALSARLSNYRVSVLDENGVVVTSADFHTNGTHTRAAEFWETGGVTGQVVKVELLGGVSRILSLSEVKVLGRPDPEHPQAHYQPMALIPENVFESYEGSANDGDDDELRDDWEQAYGFDPTRVQPGELGVTGDPDDDGFNNFLESLFETNPSAVSSLKGYLMVEQWENIDGDSLLDLFEADSFYGRPDRRRPTNETDFRDVNGFSGTRMRGHLTAPVTGTYHFWLSAKDSAELWLSSDASKYRKKRLSMLGVEIGTNHGPPADSPNRFDVFASQMSEGVDLVAGERYFFEVIGKYSQPSKPHYAIAWAVPGDEGRTDLPIDVLSSYSGEAEDGDDDYLPDLWEEEYGLDKNDNGRVNRDGEGERADFDSDLLSNREEFLAGTDPTNPDSDGDGLSDFEELRSYQTDPLVSDVTPETFVQGIAPNTVSGLGTDWAETADGVLLLSFRGSGHWQISVPSDGFWILQVEAALRGSSRSREVVPIHSSINGIQFDTSEITFGNGNEGSLRVTTPYLKAGTHEFSLQIDNYIARRSLEVLALRLLAPGGLDANQNGQSDEVERQINRRSGLSTNEDFSWSHFSPAFIEGRSNAIEFVDLTQINRTSQPEGKKRVPIVQWDRMLPRFKDRLVKYEERLLRQLRENRNRMEGTQFFGAPGAGRSSFYSYVELQRNEAIGYVAIFENLGISESRTIIWTPKNVLEGGVIHMPVGSELLLGAWVQDWDREIVSLSLNGNVTTFPATETHTERFDVAGTYVISASHPSGQSGSVTVHVRDAIIQDGMAISENRIQDVFFPGMEPDLRLDGGGDIQVLTQQANSAGQGSLIRLATGLPGTTRIASRLGQGDDEILHLNEVQIIGISDSLRNDNDIVTPIGDGLVKVASPLLVTPLPAGVTVEVTIFAGGVTFSDGSTFKRLTAADFDESGVYLLEFIMPFALLRAPCHYIRIYDAEGTEIYTGS